MHQPSVSPNEALEQTLGHRAGIRTDRSTAPVFVIGCHRSGTNLLYDTLLSAGGFAIYRGYLPIYKMLIPRFGSLENPAHLQRAVDTWLRSKGFRRSDLDGEKIRTKILEECKTGGDFIRIIMDQIARQQQVTRWAVYDPDNVLLMARIKADIPNALFVHIIRDGRDIALSLKKMGGFRPLPWNRGSQSLLATALYWEWMVHKGQQYGQIMPQDYIEIRYEHLVCDPRQTLKGLSEFLAHDLDYDRIRSLGLGRVSESNSSFREEGEVATTRPVNRWKERLAAGQIADLESLIGDTLKQLGYTLTAGKHRTAMRHNLMRAMYSTFLDAKLWLKLNTPMGRLANLSALELSDEVAG